MRKRDEYVKKLDAVEYIGGICFGLIRLPDAGFASVALEEDDNGWEHVSVSPLDIDVLPSWNDMCFVKDMFWEDEEEVLQIHPKKSEYVNVMPNCLHLLRPKGFEFPGRRN